MNKTKRLISADDSVWKNLDDIGGRYGMTGNALLAATACEIARIDPAQLWHVLGRIAEGAPEALPPTPAVSTRRIQKPKPKALTVTPV
jgi:hypothetical protein